MDKEVIFEKIIIPSVIEAATLTPKIHEIEINKETSLFGTSTSLFDSLNLISYVFILEDHVAQNSNVEFKLTAQDLATMSENPFASLELLTLFVQKKLSR